MLRKENGMSYIPPEVIIFMLDLVRGTIRHAKDRLDLVE